MGRFNLIDEPWISVIADKTGQTQEVSLSSFLKAHLYKRSPGIPQRRVCRTARFAFRFAHSVFPLMPTAGFTVILIWMALQTLSFIDDEDDLVDYAGALCRTWEMLWHSGQFPQIVIEHKSGATDSVCWMTSIPFSGDSADMAPENVSKTPAPYREKNQPPYLGK